MGSRYRRRSTLGTLRARAAFVWTARRRGSVVRWPLRLPQAQCPDPVHHITIGAGTYIAARSWFSLSSPDAHISIGGGCVIGESLTIGCGVAVSIGDGTGIGERTTIIDQHHDPQAWIARARETGTAPHWGWDRRPGEPVTIGRGCWLGVNVVVMPGVTIGDGCVIGAGSVVTRDVPPYSMAAGVPAEVLKTLNGDSSASEGDR